MTGSSSIIGLNLQPGSHTIEVGGVAAATYTAELKVTALYSGRDAILTWKATGSTFSSEKFSIKDNLPDMKILDFLTGIFKMFNLTAFIDDDGITQIRTLDSFYAGSTLKPVSYYDIGKHIDTTKSEINTTIPFNQIELKYEGTKNFFADDHEERFGVPWGGIKYKDSKFDGKKFEIKVPFEHFKFEKLVNQYDSSSTSIQWGWAANKDEKPTVGKPLLFYPIKATNVTTGFQTPTSISFIGASGHEELTTYYIPSNSIKLDASKTLNFSAEINEYSLRPFNDTLFNDYYKTYIQDVFKVERRLTKLDAFIPLAIITKLQLFDRLIISDKVYKINKITTNFENLKSQLELINVFDERKEIANLLEAISTIDLDVKTTGTTADSTVVTADAGIQYEEVLDNPIIKIPSTIPGNTPVPINNEECEVTSAILSQPVQETQSNSGVIFSHNITQLGKICEVGNLESYGFLYANTNAALIGTNLDTLIASGAVTNVKYTPSSPKSSTNVKKYLFKLNGLSQGDVKYWRFFARTNTTTNFKTADVISDIFTATAEASIVYSQTTNVQSYTIPASTKWDGNIRTIRIMNAAGELKDYKGILFGEWNFYSKIVPYIVEGNAATFNTSVGSSYPFFGLDGALGSSSYVFYHATDVQIAKNAAKSYNVGDTGATYIPIMTYENRYAEDDKNIHPLGKTNISLYASTRDSNALLADGFYSSFAGSIFEVDGLYVPDFTPYVGIRVDSANSGMARGVSVQIVNGYITNRVTYKTKND